MTMKTKKGKTYYYAKEPKRWTCIEATDGENEQSTFVSEDGEEAKFYNHDMYLTCEKRIASTIIALLPRGTYNIGISLEHTLYGDSNDSADWWRVAVPLPRPKGKWVAVKEVLTDDGVSLTLADQY